MMKLTAQSHDGIPLNYMVSRVDDEAPWIALVIPFALNVDITEHFFNFFSSHYNVITWEARLFLADADRELAEGELTVENHAKDVLSIFDAEKIDKAIIVGYCSGAGVALSALNMAPERFQNLVLVNGEYTFIGRTGCETQFAKDMDNMLSIASDDIKSAELVLDKINAAFKDDPKIPKGIDMPFSQPHYFYRYAKNYLSYRDADYESLAKNIKHKTFLISGGCDLQTNATSSNIIKDSIEGAMSYFDETGDHYEILRKDSNTLVQIWNYLSTEVDYDDE